MEKGGGQNVTKIRDKILVYCVCGVYYFALEGMAWDGADVEFQM